MIKSMVEISHPSYIECFRLYFIISVI